MIPTPRKVAELFLLGLRIHAHVSAEKDLGVYITDDLKTARQCQEAYSKASKALGLIAPCSDHLIS